MLKEDKLINEYRKRQLESQEELVLRDDGWEKLEAVFSSSLRSRMFSYRWLAAAALLLLCVIGSVYYSLDSEHIPVRVVSELPDFISVDTLKELPLLLDVKMLEAKVIDALVSMETNLLVGGIYPVSNTLSVGEVLERAHRQLASRRTKKQYPLVPVHSGNVLPIVKKSARNSWTIGLFAGNMTNNYTSVSEGLKMFNMSATRSQVSIDNAPGNGSFEEYRNELASNASNFHTKGEYSAFEQVAISNYGIPTETRIKHKFPVSGGVSVRKQLTSNLALESGLVYTLLASSLYAGEEAHYLQEQRLHYLGIPLKATYSFWKKNRLSFYVSGGGMTEFCVYGSLRSDYYQNNNKEHSSKTELDINKPQFSVMSSVGIQFDLLKPVSLYAEPGVVYYFDDKNDIETIRKQNPFNVSVHFGLRLSF